MGCKAITMAAWPSQVPFKSAMDKRPCKPSTHHRSVLPRVKQGLPKARAHQLVCRGSGQKVWGSIAEADGAGRFVVGSKAEDGE